MTQSKDGIRFHHYFERNALRKPHKTALTLGGRKTSYLELDALAEELRTALIRHGAQPDDRVVIYSKMSEGSVAAVLATLKAACIVVTTHPTFGTEKLIHQVEDSGARFLFTDDAEVVEEVLGSTGLSAVFPLGGPHTEAEGWRVRREDDEKRTTDFDLISGAKPAALFYTSGSTSNPKGVVISHSAMVAAFDAVTGHQENTDDDVILTFTPIGSDFGFYNVMMPLAFGGRVVAEADTPNTPEQLIDLVNDEGVTGIHAFPPLLALLCQEGAPHNPSVPGLRYLSSTGQRLVPEHLLRLRRSFPDVRIHSMYGLSECKRVSYLPQEQILRRPSSVGLPLPQVRAHIVDENEEPIHTPDTVGELVLAGDLLMEGYWNDPELSARTLRRDVLNESVALFTGDLFRRDNEGFLYWVRRRDEVFTRSGFQVDPQEIEAHLRTHPSVVDCAVVPLSCDAEGHLPLAFVVPSPGRHLDEQTVIDHCRGALDWHMVPSRVLVRAALPLTDSGKTDKRSLLPPPPPDTTNGP